MPNPKLKIRIRSPETTTGKTGMVYNYYTTAGVNAWSSSVNYCPGILAKYEVSYEITICTGLGVLVSIHLNII